MSGDTTEAVVCADCGKPLTDRWIQNGKSFCRDCFKAHGENSARLLEMATNAIDFDKLSMGGGAVIYCANCNQYFTHKWHEIPSCPRCGEWRRS